MFTGKYGSGENQYNLNGFTKSKKKEESVDQIPKRRTDWSEAFNC